MYMYVYPYISLYIGVRACKFQGGGRQSARRAPMARAFLGGSRGSPQKILKTNLALWGGILCMKRVRKISLPNMT